MFELGAESGSKLINVSTLLFASCLLVGLSSPLALADDVDPFFTYMRPRVGYFSRYNQASPFSRIYLEYFNHVIKFKDKAMESLSIDDWRKLRPTGEVCVDFLIGFKVKTFVLSKPYELIILDACLDWFYNEKDPAQADAKKEDLKRLSSAHKLSLETLNNDAKLREIYDNTRMKDENGLPEQLRNDIYEYLLRLLKVYSDNPQNGCHSLWLEAYNDFIDDIYVGDCEDEENCKFFGLDDSDKDSYLKAIVESTKQVSKACYKVIQKQIHDLMDVEDYRLKSGAKISLTDRLMGKVSRGGRLSESERRANPMSSVLLLTTNVNQEINLGDVANYLYKIKNGDQTLIDHFTSALSDYAKNHADLSDSSNDYMGRARFARAMIKLCGPFTDKNKFLAMTGGINTDEDEDAKKPFDFYGLIYSLVRLTNHENLFGKSKDQFEEDVLENHWEALYLSTFACQIASTAWAELDYDSNTQTFDVRLRPDWAINIIDWPIEIMNERLPLLHPKTGAPEKSVRPGKSKRPVKLVEPARSIKPERKSRISTSYFGRFKQCFKPKVADDDDENYENDLADSEPVTTRAPVRRTRPVITTTTTGPVSVPIPMQMTKPMPAPMQVPMQVPMPAPMQAPMPAPMMTRVDSMGASTRDLVYPHSPQEQEPGILSLETLELFKHTHNRLPKKNQDLYKKIYPQLLEDEKKKETTTSKKDEIADLSKLKF